MAEPVPLLAPVKPRVVAPRLWTEGRFIDDPWRRIADDEALPLDGRAHLPLARWRAQQAGLVGLGVPLGVSVGVGDAIDPATDDIARLGVIALPFPKFSDGRSYSAARRLREAGYRGEIRATGDVLLDQLPLLLRAGFDAFEINHAATIAALERAPIPAVSRVYQSAADGHAAARFFQPRSRATSRPGV
jgi:uncharacterized protein (DUF934 family)